MAPTGQGGITSRIERRKDALRVTVDVPVGELMALLGARTTQLQSRLDQYFAQVSRDVLEILMVVAIESDYEEGTVRWFDGEKGYGFIRTITHEDVFVHWRGIKGDGFKVLNKGQRVRFKRRESREQFEAIDVQPLDGGVGTGVAPGLDKGRIEG